MSNDEMMTCDECGGEFNPGDLTQVAYHMRHEPTPVLVGTNGKPIMGRKRGEPQLAPKEERALSNMMGRLNEIQQPTPVHSDGTAGEDLLGAEEKTAPELRCEECGARGWTTQREGQTCRWEHKGVKCNGTMVHLVVTESDFDFRGTRSPCTCGHPWFLHIFDPDVPKEGPFCLGGDDPNVKLCECTGFMNREPRSDVHSDVVPPEEREKYGPPKLVTHTLSEDLDALEEFIDVYTGPLFPKDVEMLRRIHTRLHVLGRRP